MPPKKKSAKLLRCPTCGSSGKSSKKICQEAYRKEIEAWRKECEDYDAQVLILSLARMRLRPGEIEAIRELGI